MGALLNRACLVAVLLIAAVGSDAAPNPVLPGTADCGVLKFAGEYYLMGVGTGGDMHVSRDLVNWGEPRHAFSMKNGWATGTAGADSEIHACDLRLLNGRFHLYWSVNHGALRQIGHAVADGPLGPYTEPVAETPFDGRIDPNAFVDVNGGLYFYTVKFTLGNVIWGRVMRDPWTLTGEDVPLLSAGPAAWELQDEPVNEAPCALYWRDRYYLFYNANHTARRYGNYAIGVAASDAPLAFRNESKYAFSVLGGEAGAARGADASVTNCGQPNLVRGPNGFEWWMVYFAIHDGTGKRNQAIDRVHFFDQEVYVEGPTTAATRGYHPAPAAPTFQDCFDGDGALGDTWEIESGDWRQNGGRVLQVAENGFASARCAGNGGKYYLFEAAVRFLEGGTQAGVLTSDILVGFDRDQKTWFSQPRFRYSEKERHQPLPQYFDWDGWHTLRIERNGSRYRVWIDEVQSVSVSGSGFFPGVRPGLFTRGPAAFDGVTYTQGWDGGEDPLFDWDAAECGTAKAGVWSSCDRGVRGVPENGEACAFKGDLLDAFEWSVQVIPEPAAAGGAEPPLVGVYGVYADPDNYLRIGADPGFASLTLQPRRNGADEPPVVVAPAPTRPRAHPPEQSGYNLRVVKLAERVIVLVEGREVAELAGTWPGAQVGLFTRGTPCRFVGISLFERSGG